MASPSNKGVANLQSMDGVRSCEMSTGISDAQDRMTTLVDRREIVIERVLPAQPRGYALKP